MTVCLHHTGLWEEAALIIDGIETDKNISLLTASQEMMNVLRRIKDLRTYLVFVSSYIFAFSKLC